MRQNSFTPEEIAFAKGFTNPQNDFTTEEIEYLINLAEELKKKKEEHA